MCNRSSNNVSQAPSQLTNCPSLSWTTLTTTAHAGTKQHAAHQLFAKSGQCCHLLQCSSVNKVFKHELHGAADTE